MKSLFTYLCILTVLLAGHLTAGAVMPGEVRWHNEQSDTARITSLLMDMSRASIPDDGEMIVAIARRFIGTPYAAGTLEETPEMLTINLDGLDCTTFIETVLAAALTLREHREGWQDFVYNLGNIRYRQGTVSGYTSRLHYISDWIVDNTHRGNISETTGRMPGAVYTVKTLDYMTRHRSSYPALADSAEFERMKNCEIGYRSHRYPYIRSSALSGKWAKENLKTGDILAFTTKTQGLDVSHLGIVVMKDDGPHLLHASSREGKVVEESRVLGEYLRKNTSITGARIIRPASH